MIKGIIGIVSIFIIAFFMYYVGFITGERVGFNDGVTTTLDSVNNIVNNHINDKTISSKFFIQSTDTLEFILSPKTIKMK